MVLIIIGSLAFQFLIRLPYFFTEDKDEQEDEQPQEQVSKSEKVKQRSEKDQFIEAYIGMFSDTLQNAQQAYKKSRRGSTTVGVQ